MKIAKQIIKIGTGNGILLDNLIMKSLNLKAGDWVDISEIYKVKYKRLPKNQKKEEIKKEINGNKTTKTN